MAPKISVIIPVYNVEKYLPECLESILGQTLKEIEIICVDDGSTDNSLPILKNYAAKDSRIKVISGENVGAGFARNKGLKVATGSFVAFFDADDFFHPQMLEKMFEKATLDQADIVICNYVCFDDVSGKTIFVGRMDQNIVSASPIEPRRYSSNLFQLCEGYLWQKLFNHAFLKKFDLSFCKDQLLEDAVFSYTAMALASQITFMPDVFAHYRKNRQNQLSEENNVVHSKTFVFYNELWERLKKYEIDKIYAETFKTFCLRNLHWNLSIRTNDAKKSFLKLSNCELNPEIRQLLFEASEIKFSVILTQKNVSKKTIESVLNQSIKEIEVICGEPLSDEVKKYFQKDKRVRILAEKKNDELEVNKAIEAAHGEYLLFLREGDILSEDALEALYYFAKIYNLDALSFPNIKGEVVPDVLRFLNQKYPFGFYLEQIVQMIPRLPLPLMSTIYKLAFLKRKRIKYPLLKGQPEAIFFMESLFKNGRMGIFCAAFREQNAKERRGQSRVDFGEYCLEISHLLHLSSAIDDGKERIFVMTSLLTQLHQSYLSLSSELQERNAAKLFMFYWKTLKKHHLILPERLMLWCQKYLQKKKLKKIIFHFHTLLALWRVTGYEIIPFSITIKPVFLLKIFGLKAITFTYISHKGE